MRRLLPFFLAIALATGCGGPPKGERLSQRTLPTPIQKAPTALDYQLSLGSPSVAFSPVLNDILSTVHIPIYLPAKVPSIPTADTYYVNFQARPTSYSVSLYDNTGKPLEPNHAPTDDVALHLLGNISGNEDPTGSVNPLPDLPVVQEIPLSMGPGTVGHMVYVGIGGPTQYGYLTWPESGWLFAVGASGPGWWISPNRLIEEGHTLAAKYRGKPPLPSIDKGSAFYSFAENQPSTLIWQWGSDIYQAGVNSWGVTDWVSTLVGVKPS